MDATGSGLDVGFLVVGAGSSGARRAAAIDATPGARLVAVCDRDDAAAHAVAGRHGTAAGIGYASALEADDVDAVVIATPTGDHFEQAFLALEMGKHVLCEPPLTIRPKHARLLALRADEMGLRLATGCRPRFTPPVRDALHLVNSWRIGRVESVRVEVGRPAAPEFLRGWATDPARSGGGTLMDTGPDACDLVRRFLGEVLVAHGFVHDRLDLGPGCESEATALFSDHDRGCAEVRSSWTQSDGGLIAEVRGALGFLRIETAPWRLSGRLAGGRPIARAYLADRFRDRRRVAKFGCDQADCAEIDDFVATIKRKHRPTLGATGWDGCRVLEMIDALYRSDRAGTAVAVQPEPSRQLGVARQSPAAVHERVA